MDLVQAIMVVNVMAEFRPMAVHEIEALRMVAEAASRDLHRQQTEEGDAHG